MENSIDYNCITRDKLIDQHRQMAGSITGFQSTITSLKSELETLKEQLEWFKRQVFGQKSERYISLLGEMGDLFGYDGTDVEEEPEQEVAGHKRKKTKKQSSKLTFDDNVPVVERLIELPESERICPKTGKAMVEFDRDVADKLVCRPAEFYVKRTIRPKYKSPDAPEEGIKQAKAEPTLFRGSKFDNSFYAYCASQKYAYHMPLNRLNEQFALKGIHMSSQTLSSSIINSARKLKPVAEFMGKRLFEQNYLFTDDTGGKALRMGGGGKAKKVHLWGYIGGTGNTPKYILYKYSEPRREIIPREHLADFSGWITADAYGGYETLHNDPDVDIRWNGCYCHARRNFEPYAEVCKVSEFMMDVMQDIFMNEREAKDSCPIVRLAMRQREQKPLIEKIYKELERAKREETLKTQVVTAINYMWNRKDVFTAFLDDPHLKIENNTAEHAMRKWKLGLNNWMFFGSENGLDAACTLMSLTQTCRAMNIDPYEYFLDVFNRMALMDEDIGEDQLEQFLPDIWLKSRTPDSS